MDSIHDYSDKCLFLRWYRINIKILKSGDEKLDIQDLYLEVDTYAFDVNLTVYQNHEKIKHSSRSILQHS
jgi:hypothetical protein